MDAGVNDRLAPATGAGSSATAARNVEQAGAVATLSGVQQFAAACSARHLVWAVSPLLRLYLARSLSRQTEQLNAMFPTHGGHGAHSHTRTGSRRAAPDASRGAAPATVIIDASFSHSRREIWHMVWESP